MKTGLFEIDPATVKTAAALLAARLAHVAKPKTPEQTLRIAFQGAVDEIARQLKFTLNWRDEYRLIEGRADSVYGGLVIEYEAPCSLRSTNRSGANSHAIQQAREYICDLQQHERHRIERYAGVACDGCFFIFLRFREGHWYVEPPVPVSPYSCARFLRYLFALQTELATTPENLLRDFGESSACARDCVRAFYNTLATSTVPKVGTLYRQWAQTFSEVCGYEENSPRLDVAALARTYSIRPASGQTRVDPFKLFFAIHTYYVTFIKLLAVQILYFYARQKVARIAATETVTLAQASSLNSDNLRSYLVEFEEHGGIFGHLGIRNFVEGDFFGWYLDGWDEPTDASLREVIRELSGYSFVTLDIDPEGTRDLLKKLYQNLVPKALRHDLGEYYTPDWLAQQLLNQLHGGRPDRAPRSPDERFLDPACGSGTFVVLHIRDVRQHARDTLLPAGKLTPRQLLDKILSNVVGYDLNPLAVISARTNYLLALGDLLDEITGDIDIPIYLADSVLTPSEGNDLDTHGKFSFRTAVGTFFLPRNLIKADYVDELANLLESCVEAGNSTDIFHKRLCAALPLPSSITVNVALRRGVRVRVVPDGAPRGRIRHTSPGSPPVELGPGDAARHLTAAVGFHLLPEGGFAVDVLEQPPVGSGLGASSAFAVALARACLAVSDRRVPAPSLVALLRDLEAAVLAAPTGVQDYYPALLGGALAIHLEPGGERVERLPVDLGWVEERLAVVFSGLTHDSGMVNWEVYRARVDGDARISAALDEIAAAAAECRRGLLAADGEAVGRAVAAEWGARRRLAPAVSNPALDAIVAAGLAAGAWAGKACGAGGGGSLLFWVPPERKAMVCAAALAAAPAGAFEFTSSLAARGATVRTGSARMERRRA